ncbi:MAG: GNAT family N-acetyltransferase [Candidatus Tantalella remota]|nr:GNAT family N-acetyltransferase [Candidatus Tantalella remota]
MIIQRAAETDWPYIKEKLVKYMLDSDDADWPQFFVAKENDKTIAFARLKDHGSYFEPASVGVDYYHRKSGIGTEILTFLVGEARRLAPEKEIYAVTHRPEFLKKSGFEEISDGPKEMEWKRQNKCIHPEDAAILRYAG